MKLQSVYNPMKLAKVSPTSYESNDVNFIQREQVA